MVRAPWTLITKMALRGTEIICAIRLLRNICVRVVCLVMLPWFELFKFILSFYLFIVQRMMKWNMIAISVPLQLVMALRREKLLEIRLDELQNLLEEMVQVKEDLGKKLDIIIKDHKHIENLLIEVEEEQHRAIEKLQHLQTQALERVETRENEGMAIRELISQFGEVGWSILRACGLSQVQVVEFENLKLKGMDSTLPKPEDSELFANGRDKRDVQHANVKQTILEKQYGESFMPENREWDHIFERKRKTQSDYFMDKAGTYHDSNKRNQQGNSLLQSRAKLFGHFSLPSNSCSKKLTEDDGLLHQWREDALAQSTFSTFLSLLVGVIAWEAQDPCMPLVIALFIVVGMSLRSVTRFFSRIERPGSDAVALLSFNWFILGTLASPTLPNVLHLIAPLASELGHLLAGWIGL